MKLRTALIVLAIPLQAAATSKTTFMINFEKCEVLIAPMRLTEKHLISNKGEPVVFTCERLPERVNCLLQFTGESAEKDKYLQYNIDFFSPPHFHFSDSYSSDYIAVNTSEHTAVLNSRLIGEEYAGAKICHGIYATTSEMEAMGTKR